MTVTYFLLQFLIVAIHFNNLFSPKQKKKCILTKNSWTGSHMLCLGAEVSSGGEEQ